MSIGKRVDEAVDKMQLGDPEAALFAICAALDATAKQESRQQSASRTSFTRFIDENMWLITDVAFGRRILNLNLAYDHPKLNRNASGQYSLQEIFYYAVRCGLYHEAKLPDDLKFVSEAAIKIDGGIVFLPASTVYGLITAVVVAPSNRRESAGEHRMFNLGGASIPLSSLWGRREEMRWLLEAVNEAHRLSVQFANKSASTDEKGSA